jgi:superfamily II DNA or RNA helicase
MTAHIPSGARLCVTPFGQLRFVDAGDIALGPGLLALGSDLERELGPDLALGRELAKLFLAALCQVPELESVREGFVLEPPEEALASLAVPCALDGHAHATRETWRRAWRAMEAAARDELAAQPGAALRYLEEKSPAWGEIGRLCLCVAAEGEEASSQLEIVATLPRTIGAHGRPLYEPLALVLASSPPALAAPIRARLERGAAIAPVLAALAEHPGERFRCAVDDAWCLLANVEALGAIGIAVMIPEWWRARRVVAPELELEIGSKEPAIGAQGALDFDARVTLDGEPLDPGELEALSRSTAPILRVRGRWVEVDRSRAAEIANELRRLATKRSLDASEALAMLGAAAAAAATSAVASERSCEVESRGLDRPPRAIVRPGPWLEALHDELRAPRPGGPSDPGSLFQGTLRPYQRRGVAWMHLLGALGVGGCLADDMGLGKTAQVLAELANRARARRAKGGAPDLVVVPASLLGNWIAEAARFTPELRVVAIHPAHDRAVVRRRPRGFECDIALTTYGTLLRSKWLVRERWGLAVLDEAQAIKNGATRQARTAKALRADARLALTGTPVENRLGDLLSILDFANPGMFGDEHQLRAIEASATRGSAELDRLRRVIAPHVLRRTKDDPGIAPELPAKRVRTVTCGLTRRQAGLYELEVQRLARGLELAPPWRRRILVATALIRLKQICNHPDHYLDRGSWAPRESAKLAALLEIARTARGRGERMLVFTQFARATDPLALALGKAFGARGLVLRGDTPVRQRRSIVETFQRGQAPFMVLSIRAGGVGLNLTAAEHVALFDRWWNPAVERQAIDRAHRIGQTREVRVHQLVCRGTLEEKIDAVLRDKSALADAIVGSSDAAMLASLDRAALLDVLALDPSAALAA